jgi:hypothetical protein
LLEDLRHRALVYKSLIGRVPFFAETFEEYYQRYRYGRVPQVGSRDRDRILQRALAKFPEDRHGSALELATVTIAQDVIRIWDAATGALVRTLTQTRDDRQSPDRLAAGAVCPGCGSRAAVSLQLQAPGARVPW